MPHLNRTFLYFTYGKKKKERGIRPFLKHLPFWFMRALSDWMQILNQKWHFVLMCTFFTCLLKQWSSEYEWSEILRWNKCCTEKNIVSLTAIQGFFFNIYRTIVPSRKWLNELWDENEQQQQKESQSITFLFTFRTGKVGGPQGIGRKKTESMMAAYTDSLFYLCWR